MNDEDILQFMNAFEDYMKHAEVEEFNHSAWTCARQYSTHFYEQKAAELKVSVEYYLQEFM